jgi:hypothetical protein
MKRTATLREELKSSMTVEELRARIFAAKETGRIRRGSLPVAEKLKALEQMRRVAAPIRAARLRPHSPAPGA